MTKSIITPAEVIAAAFSDGEYVAPEAIAEADIVAATERWVVPVVGSALLDKVAEGEYAELKSDYIAPAVALHTRLLVQPRLNAATSQLGLTAATGNRKAADKALRYELQRSLRSRAHSALRRLSNYLDANAQAIPEYTPTKNILKHCSCEGGIVITY